ncbi:unnamed protein product [Blepharisma stoltei]|uniref:F-box associated domain-containing protein n=1 Tax=Blepharisma stoltei TaxID=1481888 RepID=A0AAU9JFG6_9CILI|nr:unnamed protein product [Blepharisma stoltei]
MPKADFKCHSVVFNGNILISGWTKKTILLYSVDLNSFSKIPYGFGKFKRKILINIGRLYLIECDGFVYESEVGDEYNWKQIANSIIKFEHWQVHCSYNKGGIYSMIWLNFKFWKKMHDFVKSPLSFNFQRENTN